MFSLYQLRDQFVTELCEITPPLLIKIPKFRTVKNVLKHSVSLLTDLVLLRL